MIILSVFITFAFTLCCDPSTPSWDVVANIMSYFWNFHDYFKGSISVAVLILLPVLNYSQR